MDDQQLIKSLEGPKFQFGEPIRVTDYHPRRIRKRTFDRLVATCEQLYVQKKGRLPTLLEIKLASGLAESTIVQQLKTREFKDRMAQRGIRWTSKAGINAELTPEQVYLIAILTDPTNKKPLKEKLQGAKISHTMYRNWMKQPAFARAISLIAENLIDDHLPQIHTKVVEKAIGGDLAAAKFAYELSGRHDPAKQQMMDIQRIILLLLEVITRHVTDPNVLGRINSDIELVLQGSTPDSIGTVPANYVEEEIPEIVFNEEEIDDYLKP